jgi:hypothetical protein
VDLGPYDYFLPGLVFLVTLVLAVTTVVVVGVSLYRVIRSFPRQCCLAAVSIGLMVCLGVKGWLLWYLIAGIVLGVLCCAWIWSRIQALRIVCLAAPLLIPLPVVLLWRALSDKPRFLNSWQDALLFVERASDIAAGVTPVLPVLFLGMAIFALAYAQLKRGRLFADARLATPFCWDSSYPVQQIHKSGSRLEAFLRAPYEEILMPTRVALPVMMILLFVFCRVYSSYVPSVEGRLHDCVLLLAFAGFTLFLACVVRQCWLLWDMIHDLLKSIALLPLAAAFKRLPKAITARFGPYLATPVPGKLPQLELQLQQCRALAFQYGAVRDRLQKMFNLNGKTLGDLDRAMWYDRGVPARIKRLAWQEWQAAGSPCGDGLRFWLEAERMEAFTRISRKTRSLPPQQYFTAAGRACLRVLNAYWPHVSSPEAHADLEPSASVGKLTEETIDPYLTHPGDLNDSRDTSSLKAVQTWLRTAEDFSALEITFYLSQFFVHLRNLARSLTWGPLLAVLAIASYPFHPQRLMLTIAGGGVLILICLGLYILFHIEWDDVVSRIQKTTPQRLDLSGPFLHNIAVYTLPLLGVLAASSSDCRTCFTPCLFRFIRC